MRTPREQLLPHYPYVEGVEHALDEHGIAPTLWWAYTAAYPGQRATSPGEMRMCALLDWEPSTPRATGLSWQWGDDTGWRYAYTEAGGRRLPGTVHALVLPVYAKPMQLVDAAHALMQGAFPTLGSSPEWGGAAAVREAVDAFRRGPGVSSVGCRPLA